MEKKSKLITKDIFPVTIGVAFVWFTTHFGGGFASGAQLFSYYMPFGLWAFLMPVLAMGYNAVFFAYALFFARKHQVYDYRSFNDKFYGKFAPIFSNLFEVLYVVTMLLPPAVAFATGGSVLSALFGLPYLLCTLIIGIFIFIVAIYGTNLVRKVASTLSVLIIAGLLVVYIPNIIAQWGTISANISTVAASGTTATSFGPALWKAFLYGTFQLANIAVFVQHAESFRSPAEAKPSFLWGFAVNGSMMLIAVLGLFAVALDPDISTVSIPILRMVQNGVGSVVLTPLISLLIVLGAVSTGVNMTAAMVKRVTGRFEKPEISRIAAEKGKTTKMAVIVALCCCVVDWAVAQFGLLTLIGKGYSFIAYLAIPVILVPYIIHMIATNFDKKNSAACRENVSTEN